MRDENDRYRPEKLFEVCFFLAAEIDINGHKHNTDILSSKMSQDFFFFLYKHISVTKQIGSLKRWLLHRAVFIYCHMARTAGIGFSDVSQTAAWSVAGAATLEQGCSILLLGSCGMFHCIVSHNPQGKCFSSFRFTVHIWMRSIIQQGICGSGELADDIGLS